MQDPSGQLYEASQRVLGCRRPSAKTGECLSGNITPEVNLRLRVTENVHNYLYKSQEMGQHLHNCTIYEAVSTQ